MILWLKSKRRKMKNRHCWYFQANALQKRATRHCSTHRPGTQVGQGSAQRPPGIAGRLIVVAALLAFTVTYLYGIRQYGWGLGIIVGWLPAMLMTWLTAQGLALCIRWVCAHPIFLENSILLLKSLHEPSYWRDRSSKALKYRRRGR